MSGVYEGVGFRISTSYLVFRVDKMVASLLVLGAMGAAAADVVAASTNAMGAAADALFRVTTGRLFPWTRLANRG